MEVKQDLKVLAMIVLNTLLLPVSCYSHQTAAWTMPSRGHRLEGCFMKSVDASSSIDCAQHCLADRRCKSINFQRGTPSISEESLCKLNNCTKIENPGLLTKDQNSIYYELRDKQSSSAHRSTILNSFPSSARSCAEFIPGRHPSGNYTIHDNRGNPFTVWCHLDHKKREAWALIMSHSFSNRGVNNLSKMPLKDNAPVEGNKPNLGRYRMSLDRMNYIRSQSAQWYTACNFNSVVSDRNDSARGNLSEFDPVVFTGLGKCKRVTYINVRGYTCTNCTALWFQESNQIIHVDSYKDYSCDFNARKGAVSSEDNFGLYFHSNSDFSCSKEANSTTSWWLGG